MSAKITRIVLNDGVSFEEYLSICLDWIRWLTKKIFRFLCKIKMWLINARSCVPLWRRGFFGTFFVDYHSLTYLMMFGLKGFSDFLQKVLKLIFEKKQQIPWLCGINDKQKTSINCFLPSSLVSVYSIFHYHLHSLYFFEIFF